MLTEMAAPKLKDETKLKILLKSEQKILDCA